MGSGAPRGMAARERVSGLVQAFTCSVGRSGTGKLVVVSLTGLLSDAMFQAMQTHRASAMPSDPCGLWRSSCMSFRCLPPANSTALG